MKRIVKSAMDQAAHGQRKRAAYALVTLAFLLVLHVAVANPLIPGYINELTIGAGSWRLEMDAHTQSLDGWTISSRQGTASFKSGIAAGALIVVTPDSLLSPLAIDPAGDSVAVKSARGNAQDVVFGDGPDCDVRAPHAGWSISFAQYYYLDSTPTMGSLNDAAGSMALITGSVRDSVTGAAIRGALVIDFSDEYHAYATSDDSGRFVLNVHAHNSKVVAYCAGYRSAWVPFSLIPGDSIGVLLRLGRMNAVMDERRLPQALALHQNYPNPFNPATVISFELPWTGRVSLGLFDVTGRQVAELVHGVRAPGLHKAVWDGRSDQGLALSSGVYLARLTVEGLGGETSLQRTIKLLLVR